jgi:hypothetical protein
MRLNNKTTIKIMGIVKLVALWIIILTSYRYFCPREKTRKVAQKSAQIPRF